MTIVVVGGGAIGLLIAGQLAHARQRVAVLARPHTVTLLQEQHLLIEHKQDAELIYIPQAADDPAALRPDYRRPDIAIVCVKGYDTEHLIPTLTTLNPEQILTIQNGLGHEETLAAAFGAERVLSGIITSSAQLDGDAHVTITRAGGIGIASVAPNAPPSNDPHGPAGSRFWAHVLHDAGFTVRQYDDYRAMKWSKALLNMLANAIPTILDMAVADVYADPRLLNLERDAFNEAVAVMRRLNLQPVNLPAYPTAVLAFALQQLSPGIVNPLLKRMVTGGRGGKLPSLHADLQRGRKRSEGQYIYGAFAAAAQQAGTTAPINATLWHILNTIATGETAWDTFRKKPDRLLEAVRQARTNPNPSKPHTEATLS
ncbi:MAG: ketopantoate reductase family protein [Chloroflexaceae bacterium]|nr:ketopantoate reductase family protein [Chloroflexaceae bacterium]NJO06040.1 ketopantoate reductase family protein [Chloroflexaceae bacterium]